MQAITLQSSRGCADADRSSGVDVVTACAMPSEWQRYESWRGGDRAGRALRRACPAIGPISQRRPFFPLSLTPLPSLFVTQVTQRPKSGPSANSNKKIIQGSPHPLFRVQNAGARSAHGGAPGAHVAPCGCDFCRDGGRRCPHWPCCRAGASEPPWRAPQAQQSVLSCGRLSTEAAPWRGCHAARARCCKCGGTAPGRD